MRKYFILFTFLGLFATGFAQTKEQTGWLFLINSTKLSQNWSTHLDVQFRSADDMEYVRNFMFRPGITYILNKNANLTAGYLLNDTYSRIQDVSDNRLTEHRIWEQFILNKQLKSTVVTNRFRLEQRFVERLPADVFSQRFRYMLRAVVPLQKQKSSFSKGLFLGLQNEVFLNVQNKDKFNGSSFDQNRLYLASGYRLSKKVDIEAGYLNQYIKGRVNDTSNNVIQLALYTRF